MIATMVAVMMMETVDTLMIGRLGEEALAAAALGLTAWFVFLLFGMGLLSAVSALTAQAVAIGDTRGVRRSARQGLWIGLILGAPSAYALQYGEGVFLMLGQEPSVAREAQSFLDWLAWSLVPVFLNFPMRLTMASYGVTQPPMVIAFAAVPLNAVLNYVFIFGGFGGPVMGLAGAGVATLLAYSA
ncbi:MAG: MATE family efflux transporter, partial [Pseudomonadota bacterium]